MWPPKPWTLWTTPSGIPSSSSWTRTASKASRPWGTASPPGPAAAHASCTSSRWSWGRRALTSSPVGFKALMLTDATSLKPEVRVVIVSAASLTLLLFPFSDHWPELGQRRLVRQREGFYSGAAGPSRVGVWGQGEFYHLLLGNRKYDIYSPLFLISNIPPNSNEHNGL